MRRRTILTAAALSLAGAGAAHAAAAPPSEEERDALRTMDVPSVVIPVIDQGLLVNHLFVTIRVRLAAAVDAYVVRERNHFLRDALVRAAYRSPFATAQNRGTIDNARAAPAFRAAAIEALGAAAVEEVSVVRYYRAGEREPLTP